MNLINAACAPLSSEVSEASLRSKFEHDDYINYETEEEEEEEEEEGYESSDQESEEEHQYNPNMVNKSMQSLTINEDNNSSSDLFLNFSSYINMGLTEKQTRELFYQHYVLGKRIGKGGFGTIFSAYRRKDTRPVAIKVVLKHKVTQWYSTEPSIASSSPPTSTAQANNDANNDATNSNTSSSDEILVTTKIPLEIALMIRVRNVNNCIQIIDYLEQKNCFIIIMERDEKSQDLFDYITEKGSAQNCCFCDSNRNVAEQQTSMPTNNSSSSSSSSSSGSGNGKGVNNDVNNGGIDEHVARNYFKQIVETVVTIHKLGVIHRDIKDENILVNLHSGQLKLIDFGAGAFITEKNQLFTDFHGTRVYSPPEWILKQRYYGDRAAVWSLGVLLFNMIYGDIPWEEDADIINCRFYFKNNTDRNENYNNHNNNNNNNDSAKYSRELNEHQRDVDDLIRSCLKLNDAERIGLDKILKHKWFAMIDVNNNIKSKATASTSKESKKALGNLHNSGKIAPKDCGNLS